MLKLKFLFFFSFLSLSLQGQSEYQGIILDSVSLEPIGYVNVGILENRNGTVSEEDGKFILKEIDASLTARFSSIGYFSTMIPLVNLSLKDTIFLKPKTYGIQSIQVTTQRLGEAVMKGRKVNSQSNVFGWTWSDQMGIEIGNRIKIDKECVIKSAHFGLHKNSTDSILLRINIYDYKNGKLGKNLMPENVFIKTGNIDQYLSVDLSHLHIVAKDDVMMSLEIVNDVKYESQQNLYFRAKFKLRKTNIYSREVKHDKFKKFKIPVLGFVKPRIGFYLMVREVE